MPRVEPLLSTDPEDRPNDDALGAHHREMEAVCLELVRAGGARESRDLALRWRRLERELLEHIAAEEALLFPAYQQLHRENAQHLRAEHAGLRVHVLDIGIGIQLGTIRGEQLQRFLEALRGHARHEEATLYAWTQGNLDHNQRHTLLALLG
jgi:hemerythrin-like domain-containing protein